MAEVGRHQIRSDMQDVDEIALGWVTLGWRGYQGNIRTRLHN